MTAMRGRRRPRGGGLLDCADVATRHRSIFDSAFPCRTVAARLATFAACVSPTYAQGSYYGTNRVVASAPGRLAGPAAPLVSTTRAAQPPRRGPSRSRSHAARTGRVFRKNRTRGDAGTGTRGRGRGDGDAGASMVVRAPRRRKNRTPGGRPSASMVVRAPASAEEPDARRAAFRVDGRPGSRVGGRTGREDAGARARRPTRGDGDAGASKALPGPLL